MSKIVLLSPSVVSKIAAGEVVERPASVVKELVENAIDAEASRIIIELEEVGKKQVKVTDNGSGMSREDAMKAFEKHATSKISKEEDLQHIVTLGFRGEALYSIAAVSKVELSTKQKNDMIGTKIELEAGNTKKVSDTGMVEGTIVTIKDLFYNTPARKKFMKSKLVELEHITDIVTRFALGHSDIAFKLLNDSKIILDVPVTENYQDRLSYIYDTKDIMHLIPVNFENNIVKIEGWISNTSINKSTNRYVSIFVNGRYVKDSGILESILKGYGSLLFRNRNPIAILFLTVSPEQVDVNIHPSKIQIKFAEEPMIKKFVIESVSSVLKDKTLIPSVSTRPESLKIVTPLKPVTEQKHFESERLKKVITLEESVPKMMDVAPLGQIDNTYIVAAFENKMLIIDQHAAHERIRVEQFMKDLKKNKIQALISPISMILKPLEIVALKSHFEIFKEMGFDIELMGKDSILIRSIPEILTRSEAEEAFKDAVSEILKHEKSTRIEDLKKELFILVSCKGAIKAHQKLSNRDMSNLIYQLMQCNNPFTCPHGRPTMLTIENAELEKMFKRKE